MNSARDQEIRSDALELAVKSMPPFPIEEDLIRIPSEDEIIARAVMFAEYITDGKVADGKS